MGTPDFAVEPLKKLVDCGYDVVAAVTNNDKPVGRKKILTSPPVKQFALSKGIEVFQYDKIRIEGVEDVKNLNPDLIVTCAFGQILSQEILDVPRLGVINIHASLLPKYRGASPIHFALLNGEKTTGITIMKTDVGIDTGDIIMQKPLEIGDNETCGELFDRLSLLGAECIIEALPLIENNKANFIKQNDDEASFSKIIKKDMAQINWTSSAKDIFNQIRAFNPAPIAFTLINGEPFKIYRATVVDGKGKPGEILESQNRLIVACGEGALALEVVQKAGGSSMPIKDFLRGNKFTVGDLLTNG